MNSRYTPPTREVKRVLHKSYIAQGRKGMYSHSACLCAYAVLFCMQLASCHAEPLKMAEKGREAADSIMKGEETDEASTGGVVFDTVGIAQRRRLIWEKECQWNNLRKAI